MRWPLFLGLRLLKAVGYFKHQTPKHPHQQPSVALGVSWPKAASQAWCVASRCRRHDPLATAPATKRWDWINQNCFQDAEKTWIKNTHTKQSKNRQPKDEGRIVINFHIYHSNETFETNHVSCDSWKLGSLGIPGRPVLELLGHIRTSDQFVDDGSVGSVRFRLLFFFSLGFIDNHRWWGRIRCPNLAVPTKSLAVQRVKLWAAILMAVPLVVRIEWHFQWQTISDKPVLCNGLSTKPWIPKGMFHQP